MPTHDSLTDPDLHEPKGASTASANTIYVANGSGSGTWKKPGVSALDYADVLNELQTDIDSGDLELTGKFYLTAVLPDVSTAGSILVSVPAAATLDKAYITLGAPITVADAVLSFKDATAASIGTDVTVAYTSSATGDKYTFTATSNNVFVAGDYFEIITDGGSTDTAPVYITLEFSGVLNG